MRLKALCRAFDAKSVEVLGGFISNPHTEPHIKLESIRMLHDRGHGRPKGDKRIKHTGADGKSPVTVRIEYPPKSE
jgi:hypothetical protein